MTSSNALNCVVSDYETTRKREVVITKVVGMTVCTLMIFGILFNAVNIYLMWLGVHLIYYYPGVETYEANVWPYTFVIGLLIIAIVNAIIILRNLDILVKDKEVKSGKNAGDGIPPNNNLLGVLPNKL